MFKKKKIKNLLDSINDKNFMMYNEFIVMKSEGFYIVMEKINAKYEEILRTSVQSIVIELIK